MTQSKTAKNVTANSNLADRVARIFEEATTGDLTSDKISFIATLLAGSRSA